MATIKLFNGKTFAQMNDSEKQDLASKLVHNEIGHCFSNTFSTLWAFVSQDCEHVEYDDMYSLVGAYDYDTAVTEHINGLDMRETYDLASELESSENELTKQLHKTMVAELKNYLVEYTKWDWKVGAYDDFFNNYDIENSDLSWDEEEDKHEYMLRVQPKIVEYFSNYDNFYDFVDWIETNPEMDEWIGADLDGVKKLCFDAIDENGDLEQYSNDNNLDPTFDEAYEHWIVSSWLADKLPNTADVTGLTIWARFTTGQAICLDHNIQSIAFDVYSEEVDESEHIKKVDAIKAIISASCKADISPLVEKAILDNDTAYSLAVNNAADYDARKKLENRISNNVKKVRETLEQHNINF